MIKDNALYFTNLEARQQIGTWLDWLMQKRGSNRSMAARKLHGQFGVSVETAKGYIGSILMGSLYVTSSEEAIRRDPDKGRRVLAILISWLGIPPGHDIVAAIKKLDEGFQYSPHAYIPSPLNAKVPPRLQPKSLKVGLEKRVGDATAGRPSAIDAKVEELQQYSSATLPTAAPAVKNFPRALASAVSQNQPPVPLPDRGGRKEYTYAAGRTPAGVHYYKGEEISHDKLGIGIVVNSPLKESEKPPASYTIEVMFQDNVARRLVVNPHKPA